MALSNTEKRHEYGTDKSGVKQFLGSEVSSSAEDALFHIIPAPLEKSVSYGTGTSKGPAAIIEASQQLEKWDGYSIPGDRGIFTRNPDKSALSGSTENFLEEIEKEIYSALKEGHVPVMLGGEHTVSLAAFKAITRKGSPFAGKTGILHFDAHSDLRDIYEGDRLSHACVMRRGFELGLPLFQIGIRSLSPPEVLFRKENRISFIDAREAVEKNITSIAFPEDFPEYLYISIDVDGFDPSIFPATGTPEPGGLGWYQVHSIIESAAQQRKIIGFDVVELAPFTHPGFHASDFAAARLTYNVMGIIERSTCKP